MLRSAWPLLIALLAGLIGCASAAPCVTTTRFFPLVVNAPGSPVHMSLGGKFDAATGAVTFGGRLTFDFPSTACVSGLRLANLAAGSAVTVELIGSTDARTAVLAAAADGTAAFVDADQPPPAADCGVGQLRLTTQHGATATLTALEFCPALDEALRPPTAARLRARTLDASYGNDSAATVYTSAAYPIVPQAYCNSHITSDGAHDYCYAVFGYSSANLNTITLNASAAYYVGAPSYNENPINYYPGVQPTDLAAFWICDRHTSPYMGLVICTPMDGTQSSLAEQCYNAVTFRDYAHACEAVLVNWIDPALIPQLFA